MNSLRCGPSLLWGLALTMLASAIAGSATAGFLEELPPGPRQSVLWFADHEEGTLVDWTDGNTDAAGGGVFNTGGPGEAIASASPIARSGDFGVRATIRGARRARSGARAVRLFRWRDGPLDEGGRTFPKEAFYSTWLRVSHDYNPTKSPPWDPGDGGWWVVFQFKSRDEAGTSHPMWTLNIAHDEIRGMHFYLWTPQDGSESLGQLEPVPIPVDEWIHIEAFYRQARGGRGQIAIWQNGQRILEGNDVTTILKGPAEWALTNYTDHIAGGPNEGEATIFFDDAAVSRRRLSESLFDGSRPERSSRLPASRRTPRSLFRKLPPSDPR